MAVRKIDEKWLKRVTSDDPRGTRYHDAEQDHFGVTVYASGIKAFWITYQPHGSRRRKRMNFATYGELTLKKARERAKELHGVVVGGGDPAVSLAAKREIPTWSEWTTTYMERVEKRKKAPENDRYYLIGSAGRRKDGSAKKTSETMRRWKNTSLADITVEDGQALLEWYEENCGRTAANRWHSSVRSCLEAARRAGHIRINPLALVQKYPEAQPRQRVLSADEEARLRAAVAALADKYERVLFTVLLDTGCRLSEALAARWEDVDLTAKVWVIPSPKAGTLQAIPLPDSVARELRRLDRVGDWIFPSPRRSGAHRIEVRTIWTELKAAAKLEGVTVHDIRRSYGLAVARAAGILPASKLLRHSDVKITSTVYTPLAAEELKAVTNDLARKRAAAAKRRNAKARREAEKVVSLAEHKRRSAG